MKIKITYLFLVLVLLFNKAEAQIVFNRNYDIDSSLNYAAKVIQTFDGGYLTGGTSFNISTSESKAILVKTNADGDTLWTKGWDFSPPGGDEIYSQLQLNDSSYILLGNTYDTIALAWKVFLLKLNPNGDSVWMKRYSIGTGIDLGSMIKKTTEGGFVIAGRTTSNTSGPEDVYCIKTDSAGTLEWQYQYGGANMDAAYSIDLTPDGGYILGGQTYSYGSGSSDFCLIKINNLGSLQWLKTFGTIEWDDSEIAITTLDGGFIMAGAIDDGTGTYHGYVVKTDNAGNMQWNKTFGYWGGYEAFKIVKQLPDSSYILAGSTWLSSAVKYEGWLMKISSIGDSIWSHTYGSPNNLSDYFYGLDLAADGGFILSGQDNRIGSPYQNVWLVKTDCMGNDSAWDSASCSLTTSVNNGNEIQNENTLKIYPNPFSENTTVEYFILESEQNSKLFLYDATGRLIKEYPILNKGEGQLTIDGNYLNNGIYFCHLISGDKIISVNKIVIIK